MALFGVTDLLYWPDIISVASHLALTEISILAVSKDGDVKSTGLASVEHLQIQVRLLHFSFTLVVLCCRLSVLGGTLQAKRSIESYHCHYMKSMAAIRRFKLICGMLTDMHNL